MVTQVVIKHIQCVIHNPDFLQLSRISTAHQILHYFVDEYLKTGLNRWLTAKLSEHRQRSVRLSVNIAKIVILALNFSVLFLVKS